MTSAANNLPLRFVQIGDLHLTGDGLQNRQDFVRIVHELNRHAGSMLDFVYLPGDNADDGTDDQFSLVRGGLNELRLHWHAIPGDHDFKPRSLESFYRGLNARKLPYVEEVRGCRCLFLDVVTQGTGGPDFKLGSDQFAWLKDQLEAAKQDGNACVVFMHAYPADLGEEAEELTQLLDQSSTVLVAMGHTHYNEIAHDGRTIYAATRSTGQIEEGPVGFSFAAVDGNVVSWRFKPLESSWPFVMITSPADRRLALRGHQTERAREVRACAWGAAPVVRAQFRVDEGPWQPMSMGERGLFTAPLDVDRQRFRIEVCVTDQRDESDTDTIAYDDAGDLDWRSTGSDSNAIGAWPERHLFGTQLGPNRHGRKW
ncbi:hypothetical protein UP10_02535 [Bradyrhizobium sp. LTSPM299]|uniref:metallophosphoesterase family protein n=1 Tax=Bradyrhizobium sp. LTSPM299 TaxID=1619233 RepID=UPI0005CB077D|nr:metallophosphoesterase [Bradyrhizobium sp. LTSPM299]KJC62242.1 hypothetical protein UP10_02535 [Bradyrhizobium sp. LTSPM299]